MRGKYVVIALVLFYLYLFHDYIFDYSAVRSCLILNYQIKRTVHCWLFYLRLAFHGRNCNLPAHFGPLYHAKHATDVLASACLSMTKGSALGGWSTRAVDAVQPPRTLWLLEGDLVASPRATGTRDQGSWMLETSSGINFNRSEVFSSFVSLALFLEKFAHIFKHYWMDFGCGICCCSFLVGSWTVEGRFYSGRDWTTVDWVGLLVSRNFACGAKENCPKESRARLKRKNLIRNNKFPLPLIGGSFFTGCYGIVFCET